MKSGSVCHATRHKLLIHVQQRQDTNKARVIFQRIDSEEDIEDATWN